MHVFFSFSLVSLCSETSMAGGKPKPECSAVSNWVNVLIYFFFALTLSGLNCLRSLGQATTASTITCVPHSALAIQSSALAVLAVRQQNIYCSPAPSTIHSEGESGPDHTPEARKLYGSLRDLQCTATFIGETGVSI